MTLKYKITADDRRKRLAEQIHTKGFVRLIEAHSGLSALVGESIQVRIGNREKTFDGFWESSLTDAGVKGLPDAEITGNPSRLHTIDEILNVTSKPMIVDGDTGGSPAQFEYFVRNLERLGVSAVIIEDKAFPKRNSLDLTAKQTLENPQVFAQKIERGQQARITRDFLVIARIESLIAGFGVEDALARARIYMAAGVDGIMIHSKKDDPREIYTFADQFQNLCSEMERRPYLVCVPTAYNLVTDQELANRGFDVIIHANHLLRAAHRAMLMCAGTILLNDRSFETDALCATIPELFAQVGFDRVKRKDLEYSQLQRTTVIIPAAGQDPIFRDVPKSLIEINLCPILEYQLLQIRKTGLDSIVVVRGYEKKQFDRFAGERNLTLIDNKDFKKMHSLHSLFCAEAFMKSGFLLAFSDILFNAEILNNLMATKADILICIDKSYRYHRHEVEKKLDLVVGKRHQSAYHRSLGYRREVEIGEIGKLIQLERAQYEFIGLAYFSEEGARIFRKVYHDCLRTPNGCFHESDSFYQAGITDLLQEVIDRGFSVHGMEVYQGWMEIHNLDDVTLAACEINAISAGETP